ncbi:MAG TPA: M67 family metallopeptidase, partial [Chitinophagaceae bacterium]
CGFMFGKEEGPDRIISSIRAVNNSSDQNKERRFAISPRDYMDAEKTAIENHVELLGVYHSHPGHPSVPSETDRQVAQPFFSYLIVSVVNGDWADTRSWRLTDERQFEEEQLTNKISN